MNFIFYYQYRDNSNYKLKSEYLLSNDLQLSLEEVRTQINKSLIINEYFIPEFLNMQRLGFDEIYNDWSPDQDNTWHEYLGLEHIENNANELNIMPLSLFLKLLSRHSAYVNNIFKMLA